MDSRKTRLFCFVFIISSCFFNLSKSDELKVMVKGVTSIAQTDDNFICATLDWWPENKCDYNQCPWGKAGLLNLVKVKIYFYYFFIFLVRICRK